MEENDGKWYTDGMMIRPSDNEPYRLRDKKVRPVSKTTNIRQEFPEQIPVTQTQEQAHTDVETTLKGTDGNDRETVMFGKDGKPVVPQGKPTIDQKG